MSADLDRGKDVVRAHFAALSTGDYSALESIHDPDGRNHAPAPFDLSEWPPEGRPFGPAEVRETFDWLRAGAPDLNVEIEDLVAEGDKVIAWLRMTGTHTGSAGPLPPTGRRTDVYHAHRFRVGTGGSLSTGRSAMTSGPWSRLESSVRPVNLKPIAEPSRSITVGGEVERS